MTPREFKDKLLVSLWNEEFQVWDISTQDINDIADLVMIDVENLFDELEAKDVKILQLEERIREHVAREEFLTAYINLILQGNNIE